MDILGKILGAAGLQPQKLAASFLHHATPALVEPVLENYFLHHMTADARVEMGKDFEAGGKAFEEGRVRDAATHLAAIFGRIKLPGLD